MNKVYISATFEDLEDYIKAVYDAIQTAGMLPVVIRHDLIDSGSLEQRRQQLEECDFFVGIYGHWYGDILESIQKSIIEIEYEWATEKRMPMFLFSLAIQPGPPRWARFYHQKGTLPYNKLHVFKAQVSNPTHYHKFFTTPQLLVYNVKQALKLTPQSSERFLEKTKAKIIEMWNNIVIQRPITSNNEATMLASLGILLSIQALCCICSLCTGGGGGYGICFQLICLLIPSLILAYWGYDFGKHKNHIPTVRMSEALALLSLLAPLLGCCSLVLLTLSQG